MFPANFPDWLPAIIWLILIVIFIIVEAETLQLVSIWFALGAVSAMLTSFFLPGHLLLQVGIFIVVSVVILVTVRDFAKKKLKVGSAKTNVNALIGRHVKVTKRIEPYQYGEVRVGGTTWTAVGLQEEIIDVGEIVEIVEISGVKLVVQRVNKQIEQK
ncbi:MAG TPA: NfeD family protein [Haloplasmataceae bacterium]